MDTQLFLNWLTNEKAFSKRAAKDVISRCRRVYKILESEQLNRHSLINLQEAPEYQESSLFVKSQLKRAILLYLEFTNSVDK